MALAEAGAAVAWIDLGEQRADRVAGEIVGQGGGAVLIVAQTTDPVQVGRAIDEAVVALVGIDVSVDIIGGANWSKVEDFTTQLWDAAIDYNLTQVLPACTVSRSCLRAAGRSATHTSHRRGRCTDNRAGRAQSAAAPAWDRRVARRAVITR